MAFVDMISISECSGERQYERNVKVANELHKLANLAKAIGYAKRNGGDIVAAETDLADYQQLILAQDTTL